MKDTQASFEFVGWGGKRDGAGRPKRRGAKLRHAPRAPPREVRNAICYVLQNTRRHETTEQVMVDPSWVDPRSSGPQTWLLAQGWLRHGLVRVDEVPPAAFG